MTVSRCSADILTERAALETQLATGRPFVVEKALQGALAGTSLETFVELYGDRVVRISSLPFFLPFSTEQCSLRDYVREITNRAPVRLDSSEAPVPYVFHDDLGLDSLRQRSSPSATPIEIAKVCPLPDLLAQIFAGRPLAAIRIGLGPRGSHTGVHRHGIAFNQLVFGRKRWFLYPADTHEEQLHRIRTLIGGARALSPQLFWFEHFHSLAANTDGDVVTMLRQKAEELSARGLYEIPSTETWSKPLLAETLRGVEVTQEAGDLVVVPARWLHAIINDAWSLSVIYELTLKER